MGYRIIFDDDGNALPQYVNTTGTSLPLIGDKAPYGQLIDANGNLLFVPSNPGAVRLTGNGEMKCDVQDVTTAGTPVRLPAFACHEVTIIAKRSNLGTIYVGGSDVASNRYGVAMEAKESITLAVSNLNMIYIDASVNGEGVSYVAL